MTLRTPRVSAPMTRPGAVPSIAAPEVAIQAQEAAPTIVGYTPRLINFSDKPHPDTLPIGHARRLLFVSHVLPYPPRAGNEYRIHRLLSWLAGEGWDIFVVLCPLTGDPLSETQKTEMAAVYPNLIICQRDGTVWHNLADRSDLLEPLRGVVPRPFKSLLGEDNAPPQEARIIQLQRTFCPDVLVELLLQLDGMLQPEVLIAEYVFMTRPFALLRREMIKVVDTIDVFSTKANKVERYGVSDGLALTEDEEALLLHSADIVIGIQPDEAADLARLSPGSQVLSIGVDFPVNQVPRSVPTAPTAVLVASANPMNVKGVQSFLRYAWPLVLQTVPNAVLRVIGPIGDVIEDAPPGVEIVGRVDDLGPEYADARVAINPAIAGTGLKIKTVEALCHLRPVVTWPAGVEGIGPEARPFCHVATHWFGFAQALIRLLTDDEEAGAIGKAQEALTRALSPTEVYAPLRNALEQGRR
jgi:glycosyltransferase involved in cell wall biosynthesis